jgi:outer membrane protein assembly factor BamB
MNCLRFVPLILCCVLLETPVNAKDWPEFRGPTGQGLVEGGALPVHWDKTTNVVWKCPIPGRGWSSPVIVGRRIYMTTSVPIPENPRRDQSLRALCLDGTTGKVLWTTEVFRQDASTSPGIHGKNSHASPTPVVYDRRLYVHFGHQGTACLDLAGKVLWRNQRIRYAPVHGNGGSPIVVDRALVFSCDGSDRAFVIALDRNNGKVLWQTERSVNAEKKFSFSTPLVITVKGQKQIISPGSDMVGAYDPKTGKEIWKVRYDGYSVIPRPVVAQGLVFVSTGFNSPSLLAIRPDGHGDVTATHVVWKTGKGAPHTPSVLAVGTELYMVSDAGLASCLDARTGKAHWRERLGGTYSASPVAAAGKIYFQSEDGTGVVVEASKQFKRLASNRLGERTLASYAASSGALYLRTAANLYRIQGR